MFYCERYFLKLLTLSTTIKFQKEIIFVHICVWSQVSFLLSITTIINIELFIINVYYVKSNLRPPNNITPKPHSFFSRNCTSKNLFFLISNANVFLRFDFFFKLLKKYKEYMSILDWSDIYTFKTRPTRWLMFPRFNCWPQSSSLCLCPDDTVIYSAYTLHTDDAIGGVCFVYTILRFILSAKRTGTATSSSEEFVSGWLNYGETYDGCFNQ